VGLANLYIPLKPKVEPQTLGFDVHFNAGKFNWRDFRFFLMSLQESKTTTILTHQISLK
jgi:hypothetical protein